MLQSWRTTIIGVATFVGVLGMQLKALWDEDPSTVPDWNVVVAAFGVMAGLFTARDNQVTSEEAGAKTEVKPEQK